MPRSVTLVLTCLTLCLVLLPLGVGKPGMPPSLKADEPAYYLMSMSLAFDQDLRCDPQDTQRLFDEFPYLPVKNLIVMSDDGWQNVFYGKPFMYSLLTAPFARVFGANGIVAFNMLLFCSMIWMAVAYLRRFNPDSLAITFAVGYFILSSSWSYIFWLHPEIYMMTTVMASLFLIFYPFDVDNRGWWSRLATPALRPFWAAAILAAGAYHKPQLAIFALPVLYQLFKREGMRGIGRWVAGGAVASVLLCGFAYWQTGHPSAYLGVQRSGVHIYDAGQAVDPPKLPLPKFVVENGTGRHITEEELAEKVEERKVANSWHWMFRIPDVSLSRLVEEGGYFLWGRHTGLFVYMPFTVLALLMFAVSKRDLSQWLLLLSLAGMALFNMLWIPHNWHGGGGFVGNRYFVIAYPAFLFLFREIRPRAGTYFGYAAGALLVGPLVLTPFGASVPKPTLQAHVRNSPTRYFPFEFALRTQIPGYVGVAQNELWWDGRRDVFKGHDEAMWFQGGAKVETWIKGAKPVETMALLVRSLADNNRITISSDAQTIDLNFPERTGSEAQASVITLDLGDPIDVREKDGVTGYSYRVYVTSKTGAHRPPSSLVERFYVGASITYLGPPDFLTADLYDVEWGDFKTPKRVEQNEEFELDTVVYNRSPYQWANGGPARVKMSYRWIDEQGSVVAKGGRAEIDTRTLPDAAAEVPLKVQAPATPGKYTLELDLILEHVSWFAERNDVGPYRASVRVVPSKPAETEDLATDEVASSSESGQ